MASDPLSYYGIWYWPEDKDGPTCFTAIVPKKHFSCSGKNYLKYGYETNPKVWVDTKVEFYIGPKTLIEWSEE